MAILKFPIGGEHVRKLVTLIGEQDDWPNNGTINQPSGLISAVSNRSACWLEPIAATGEASAAFRFRLPFGVVIGDSISAGSPQTRSRMQIDGTPGFSSDHINVPGQLSYELGAITGLHWYNHGIGGQRTDEIWARWRRDVLAETVELGDSRSARTLQDKPYAVFIIAGINDVFQNRDDAFIQRYWIQMAQSAKDHGILCIFSNMGEHNAATPAWRDQIRRLNRWMSEHLPAYGATVVDFYEWSKNRERGIGVHPGLFVDDVHPSRSGFQSLAYHYAAQWVGLPIYLHGLQLENVIDADKPLETYSRPHTVSVQLGSDYARSDSAPKRSYTCMDRPANFIPVSSDGTCNLIDLHVRSTHRKCELSGYTKVRAVLDDWMNME